MSRPTVQIEIQDEINAIIKGLDPDTLKKVRERLTFFVPNFRFMPAFRLGWDGRIRLVTESGKISKNLIEDVIQIIDASGYDISLVDNRPDISELMAKIDHVDQNYLSEYQIDGQPIILRDYQVDAVNTAISTGNGILELATGSGKTLCCGTLAKVYERLGNVVVIVPEIALILQTSSVFRKIGIDCGVWYGSEKYRRPITIATWQSLDRTEELFEDVVMFIVDEAHNSKAKVLSEILSGPAKDVPFRFGCTGTLPKSELFRYQIKASIGPTLFTLRTWELQQMGVLAEAKIYQVKFKDSKNKAYKSAQGTHDEWKKEVDWIFSDPDRVAAMATMIREISKSGNTMVLLQYKWTGKRLEELLPEAISVDGDDKGSDRFEIFQEINKADNQILIATLGVGSTGVDIPRLHNLVMIEPGKGFIKILQSLGRGLRKQGDKQDLTVYDLHGDAKFSKSHANERKKLFLEAKQSVEHVDMEYV